MTSVRNYVMQPPPRLVKIQATKLLGLFNHTVEFPAPWDFVIVYGPNGVGKTRLLELVRAAAGLQEQELLRAPFERLDLSFDDGSRLAFARSEVNDQGDNEPRVVCQVTLSRPGSDSVDHLYESWDPAFEQWLEQSTSWAQHEGQNWIDQNDGEIVPLAELYDRFTNVYRASSRRAHRRAGPPKRTAVPDEITEYASRLPVHLIETQRLLTLNRNRMKARDIWHDQAPRQYVQTVKQHSLDLQEQIAGTVTEHSRLSQQLDRTFPRRIIERAAEEASETNDTIRAKYQAQNELRSRLASFSLIDAQGEVELPKRPLVGVEIEALAIYLEDTEKKLAVFTGLLERLELFVKIMNSRLVRKSVSVDVNKGLTIYRSDHDERSEIPSESLSSGEQHELVLFYDLLFGTERDSLVMIDEPEISLHVVWQRAFLNDISQIAKLSSLRFVVATHSPQIIDTWWERTSELGAD